MSVSVEKKPVSVVGTVADLRKAVSEARQAGRLIGFVPTMGALHKGHGALMDRARAECGYVVASIFVNPLQFDRPEDYQRYARTMPADLEYCGERGVDLVFAPTVQEMYPHPQQVFIDVPALSECLCGQYRPGHFRAVATVVTKLFHMAQPDRAYFGEKDAQQLAVVQALVADLNLPITVVPISTVREPDGLALSSRNVRLSPAERQSATALYRALSAVAESLSAGAKPSDAREAGLAILSQEPAIRLEYLELVDPSTLRLVDTPGGSVRIMTAAWVGETRLIDNILHLAGSAHRSASASFTAPGQ